MLDWNRYMFGDCAEYDNEKDGDFEKFDKDTGEYIKEPRRVLLIIKGTYKKNGDTFTYVQGLYDNNEEVYETNFKETSLQAKGTIITEPSWDETYYAEEYGKCFLIETGELPFKEIETPCGVKKKHVDEIAYYEKYLGKGNVIFKTKKNKMGEDISLNGKTVKYLDVEAMKKAGAIDYIDYITDRFPIDDFTFEIDGWRYSLTNDEINQVEKKYL